LLIVAKIPNLPENEGLQGEIIAETLDELSKKLVRVA